MGKLYFALDKFLKISFKIFLRHHDCIPLKEKCMDLENTFRCVCGDGYQPAADFECIPICPLGCEYGFCEEPNFCKCDFGYVGANCSTKCSCNGHSVSENLYLKIF